MKPMYDPLRHKQLYKELIRDNFDSLDDPRSKLNELLCRKHIVEELIRLELIMRDEAEN